VASTDIIQSAAQALYGALRSGEPIAPLTETYAGLTVDQAYDVSLAIYAMRKADGEKDIGKKIGITSDAVMKMLGVNQPDFGFLTDMMWAKDNVVDTSNMILPRAEAEIAFKMKADLNGPGVTEADVLAATEAVAACFEIVDSRVKDWKIKIQDTIADNASCGTMAIGPNWVDPNTVDLLACKAVVTKNGEPLSEGVGAATLGSPLKAVAWLANTLGERGIPFKAGEIILSGSLVPLEPVQAGDKMHVSIEGIGECEVSFK
jgi:2-oxopent-4-enoate/cis-2-oxohex-4-enoate hydratase